jgi:hypothetical protein
MTVRKDLICFVGRMQKVATHNARIPAAVREHPQAGLLVSFHFIEF